MRTERCVVIQCEVGPVLEVPAGEGRPELQIEHFLQRSPEPLDDGNRARRADRP